MTQPVPQPVYLLLGAENDATRIAVEFEAFVKFSAEIDASLAQLEAQWKGFAPARRPAVSLRERRRMRPK